MDKSNNAVNVFTSHVEQLRNTECSQKEKIAHFQQIAECILSPALLSLNYATHCSTAANVLLLFCEDLDSVVRMSAEENLNKIFRSLEQTRVSRILMDLYGEIKRNGNQRSLRICLNLFSYYAPQIKEKHVEFYAQRLLPHIQTIAQRKETQLCETLCEFVKNFGRYLQLGLSDSETCKLLEVFMANIGAECAVKRRCSAQNCISLIENSRNKSLMAKHGLSKVIELLLADQQQSTVLGALGCLRLLLPHIIRGFSNDCSDDEGSSGGGGEKPAQHTATATTGDRKCHNDKTSSSSSCGSRGVAAMSTTPPPPLITNESRQIIEIYDYCLHLLSATSNHATINAALEVINAILQALDSASADTRNGNECSNTATAKSLQQLLSNQQLQQQQNELLRRRKSLKNQIFQLKNYEIPAAAAAAAIAEDAGMLLMSTAAAAATTTKTTLTAQQQQQQQGVSDNELQPKAEVGGMRKEIANVKILQQKQQQQQLQTKQQRESVVATSSFRSPSLSGNAVGIYVGSGGADATSVALAASGGNVAADSEDAQQQQIAAVDVDNDDDDDNHVEASQSNTAKQRIRNTARSISECVAEDDDVDDFTTLSDINEGLQKTTTTTATTLTFPLATTIDVVNLIDAIDAAAGTTKTNNNSNDNFDKLPTNSVEQKQHQQRRPQNLLTRAASSDATSAGSAIDDKSQLLSDFDNESFNSIDFEAEITIGGGGGGVGAAAAVTAETEAGVGGVAESAKSSDTIGSFFNNLISHSNAASESVSKLFRQSSTTTTTASKTAPTKSAVTATEIAVADKSDAMSITTSISMADTLSLTSTTSGVKVLEADIADAIEAEQRATDARRYSSGTTNEENTLSSTASVTASTAVLVDTNTRNTAADCSSDEDEKEKQDQTNALRRDAAEAVEFRRKPNANPFLLENSPLKQTVLCGAGGALHPALTLQIGTIYEQTMLRYTARFIAARFLLTGQAGDLQPDATIRVSIKSLALSVLAQCVRLAPQLLQLPLEISAAELRQLELGLLQTVAEDASKGVGSPSGSDGSPTQVLAAMQSDSSGSSGSGYEHLDAGGDLVDFIGCDGRRKSPFAEETSMTKKVATVAEETLLLDIKYDHFGKGSCDDDYFLNPPLSRSADPVLFTSSAVLQPQHKQQRPKKMPPPAPLSKSEIIETKNRRWRSEGGYEITETSADAPPPMLPPRPPKRTKSMRQSSIAAAAVTASLLSHASFSPTASHASPTRQEGQPPQQQQQLADILLYFNHADPMLRGAVQQIIGHFIQASSALSSDYGALNLQHLLAILIKGLQDETYTVVIQALNAFDKIFPCVVSKYLTESPSCHYHRQQHGKGGGAGDGQTAEEAAVAAVAAAARKCQDNNAFSSQKEQQHFRRTNDAEEGPPLSLPRPVTASFTTSTATTTTEGGEGRAASSAETTCPRTLFTSSTGATSDNDELIAALLNAFQLKSKQTKKSTNDNGDPAAPATTAPAAAAAAAGGLFLISPKLLLNKLRLCHHNKYWLVQNKYAEVISNLNYAALRSYYGNPSSSSTNNADDNSSSSNVAGDIAAAVADVDDVVCAYETLFLDELLQLIGDDDFRVREHAATCLCRFIIQNAQQQQLQQQKQEHVARMSRAAAASAETTTTSDNDDANTKSLQMETYQTNFNLLWDFFDYRIFGGMSSLLRNLFSVNSSLVPPAVATAAAAGGISSVAFGMRREMTLEAKVLAKVLYRMTNKLMQLNDKNLQFGIIYALKVLLQHFNFIDYQRAWTEFNFAEICMKFCYYNYATAADLNCQNDLIDVTAKLMAGAMLNEPPHIQPQQQLDQLLTHTMKLLNIYYHLVSNQRPLLFAKVQKSDLFGNARELALVQSVGYFGSDYVYIKLYNTLRSANDSYKITINQESGSILIALLKTCLNALSLCIELRAHATPTNGAPPPSDASAASAAAAAVFPSSAVLKLIEEILLYLTKLVNYAPGECIACLRQLLKYLFAQNYGNRQQDYYVTFVRPYFEARRRHRGSRVEQGAEVKRQHRADMTTTTTSPPAADSMSSLQSTTINSSAIASAATPTMTSSTFAVGSGGGVGGDDENAGRRRQGNLMAAHTNYGGTSSAAAAQEDYRLFGELFASALQFHACRSERENECARHIKLFEPLVIYCLTLFMKSNAKVQAPILELLSQLLDLNVTYSILDSKSVIFEQILSNLDLIERGIVRNGHLIAPPMIKFFIQLTHKSDRQLITIPKIISIANNLLANNAIRSCAVLALKSLAYELFFMASIPQPTVATATTAAPEQQRGLFQSPIASAPLSKRHDAEAASAAAEALLANARELETQKEVVLGMCEKFIDAAECQQVLALLLLRDRAAQQLQTEIDKVPRTQSDGEGAVVVLNLLQPGDPGAVYAIVCRAMCESRLRVDTWPSYFVLDAFFRNNGNNVLADSKEFLGLLQLLIVKDVANFSDLSYATIILANVILKTEEIYLVNHIKLYLKNHPTAEREAAAKLVRTTTGAKDPLSALDLDGPSTSSAAAAAAAAARIQLSPTTSQATPTRISEINYFAKVLCEKLEACLSKVAEPEAGDIVGNVIASAGRRHYATLALRFVGALHEVCCRSRHKDALQSVFRSVLSQSQLLDKYCNLQIDGGAVGATPTLDDTGNGSVLQLQLEVFKLLSAMKLLDPLVLLQQLPKKSGGGCERSDMQRALLRLVFERNPNPMEWSLQQVQQLCSESATFLNFLIAEHFVFVCNLCEVDEEFCSLLQRALLRHVRVLNKNSIRSLLRLVWRVCNGRSCSTQCVARFLQLLAKLHWRHSAGDSVSKVAAVVATAANWPLQVQLERLARRLIALSAHDKNALYDCFIGQAEEDEEGADVGLASDQLKFMLLSDLKNLHSTSTTTTIKSDLPSPEPCIVDEKWLYAQLIKFSTQPDDYDPQQLTRILLEIQSENKLHKIFSSGDDDTSTAPTASPNSSSSTTQQPRFDVARVLPHAIASSLRAMLATFRNNCVQHNPHIHYMQPNPLARVACTALMALIASAGSGGNDTTIGGELDSTTTTEATVALSTTRHLCQAVIELIDSIHKIETAALAFVEARLIEKFIRENLLRPSDLVALLNFLAVSCHHAQQLLALPLPQQRQQLSSLCLLLRCIEKLLQQPLIWQELNQTERFAASGATSCPPPLLSTVQRNRLLCNVLDVLYTAASKSLQNTIFYKRFKVQPQLPERSALNVVATSPSEEDETALLLAHAPKVIFLAQLIETKSDIDAAAGVLSVSYLTGVGGCGLNGAAGAGGSAGISAIGCSSLVGAVGGGGGHVAQGVSADFEGMDLDGDQVPLSILASIGIAILRTNQFYAYAVTPFEIVQQQQREQHAAAAAAQAATAAVGNMAAYESPKKRAATAAAAAQAATSGKLPTIPVESLSDVDVLRKFVKRLSIFGFTTRQQFEEYFMTFLLLINKVYDENMVDQQEQFQIKSTCLEAILELLITYKTFPIVGNKVSHFHHTTRWSRINCDSISLKKLHKVQMLVSDANVFYHPNLERDLTTDSVIGTRHFLCNQYDLNFSWQQMEAYAQPSSTADHGGGGGGGDYSDAALRSTTAGSEDVATKNFRYFTALSGVDFKSSAQLIFDVLMQIIEHNHILVLPNLVKFCEICESRDQIKWIKDKALKLQETIPMDDTISHQHLIYLACKTQALLIPTLSELQHLCTLIGAYLKSSHVFIRNATLAGVLCLLECCSKTNTSIGKLSEELSLLRDLIIGYVNRHGIIDKCSAVQCSDTHTRLVWTLNYSLIEWTSKFVPQCHLLSNTIIAAGNFLKKTGNEDVYLCVLHGLERLIVTSNNSGSGVRSTSGNSGSNSSTGGGGGGVGGVVTPVLRNKIEKLALELVKLENEKFSIPALKLLLSCMYVGSAKQLENTELSNGIVQDDPEIIAQQTDKVDILLHCIKSSTRDAAWIYGQVLCQIIRDLVPPNEILTKVIKEFLAINQPHCDVIAMIVYQVFRSAIDSSFLQMLQDWLICTLPTFLALPEQKGVWALSVIFLSASINLHLIKLFPVVLGDGGGARGGDFHTKLGQHEIALFVTAAQDFHAKLSAEQRMRFRDAFKKFEQNQVYAKMLLSLCGSGSN